MKYLVALLLCCTLSCASRPQPKPVVDVAVEREIAAFQMVDCTGRLDGECDPPTADEEAFVVPAPVGTATAGDYLAKVAARARILKDRSDGKTWRDMGDGTTTAPPITTSTQAPVMPAHTLVQRPNATAPAPVQPSKSNTLTYVVAIALAAAAGLIYAFIKRR